MKLFKCFLCDRLNTEEKSQEIIVNGKDKHPACKSHDIDPAVASFDFTDKPKKPKKLKLTVAK